MTELLLAFAVGLVLAALTTPVGISGAVFLLPVQLQVLAVPSPQVTATNLLYNVISAPGALWKLYTSGALAEAMPLTLRLLAGTLPGMVVGAAIRVFAVPGEDIVRLLAVLLLAPIAVGLLRPGTRGNVARRPGPVAAWVSAHQRSAGFVVGVVGGLYGIGGGSLLSPLLVAGGLTVGVVAPAALAATWVTSLAGAAVFTALAPLAGTVAGNAAVSPAWGIGLACGVGGLIGGYLGAHARPHLPERALRVGLGLAAAGISALYLVQLAI